MCDAGPMAFEASSMDAEDMRTSANDFEQRDTSLLERLLFVGLVGFLLLGLGWCLWVIEEAVPLPEWRTDRESLAHSRLLALEGEVQSRSERVSKLRDDLLSATTLVEELDAAAKAAPSARTPARLEEARIDVRRYQALVRVAEQNLEAKRAALRPARAEHERIATAQRKERDAERIGRMGRLVLLQGAMAIAYSLLAWGLWSSARRAAWRYRSLLTALVVSSVILGLWITFRFSFELLPEALSPAGLSVAGIVACGFGIVRLTRWLSDSPRLTAARLWRRQCIRCGASFGPEDAYCWNCGKTVQEPCPACGGRRVAGAPCCSACGKEA